MAKVLSKTLSRARALRRTMTDAEVMLWSRLRQNAHGIRFRRQHPVGPYIADFACIAARLIVEVDGETHSSASERRHDARRDAFLRKNGWHVVRIWNGDVYRSADTAAEFACAAARTRLRELAPSTAARSPSPMLRTGEEKRES